MSPKRAVDEFVLRRVPAETLRKRKSAFRKIRVVCVPLREEKGNPCKSAFRRIRVICVPLREEKVNPCFVESASSVFASQSLEIL